MATLRRFVVAHYWIATSCQLHNFSNVMFRNEMSNHACFMVDVFFFCVVFLLSHYFAVELPIICVFFLGKLFDENVKQLR